MQEYISNSLFETKNISEIIAKKIKKGNIIAFLGGMGYGKTTFIKTLIKALGNEETVTSPTFNIVNEYDCGDFKIYHFDMFRIKDEDELYNIGFYDYLDKENILLIEWSENIIEILPEKIIKIKIEILDKNKRKFIISGMN